MLKQWMCSQWFEHAGGFGVVIGLVSMVCVALCLGGMLAWLGFNAFAIALGGMLFAMIVVLRWDSFAVTGLMGLHLYVDWYLGYHIFAPTLACVLLALFYLLRAPSHPWIYPRFLWLWFIFLLLTIYPALRGGLLMTYDAASFYPSDILGALLMYWLGNSIVRDPASLRAFFRVLTCFAVLLALHTLFQSLTGTALFASSRVDAFLSRDDVAYYQLLGTDTHRIGSFFIDPNWNGAFFALLFFLPLGLFVSATRLSSKLWSLLALVFILLALMSTYSTGAWVAFLIGLGLFLFFVGRANYILWFPIIGGVCVALVSILFPEQIALQLQHASANNELSLRIAVWKTALRVVQAYPWTGIGLGHQIYLLRSNEYRVPDQFVLLSHPHNSYLEWAAMAGLPVLCVFLALLLSALWLAWRNWRWADPAIRPLLGAGMAAAFTLSINSISINGWTHFALAMIAWPILGAVASPLLAVRRDLPIVVKG